ncbi:MAG: Asp-tRNA(Asn)/Glu-tRNA(Gln) amidotransferase subunit GatC [Acidobacteria bacterium]|nr:Asp-tRNA(Asn)/Glu-tRNA(Gln) amidotransferase subunit GatC [Acidobacteriota bacterium]
MQKKQMVSEDEVRHVATLANLELTTKEQAQMQRDLNSILSYIAELNELNTSDVPPLAQVSELLTETPTSAWLREDIRRESLNRELVMDEAPETDGRFFKVPKVIER